MNGRRQLVVFLALACGTAAVASGADTKVRQLGDDVFAAGDEVRLVDDIAGDVLAAGGNVTLAGTVGGDAVVAGGRVRIGGRVNEDLYASGGELRVSASIDGNARVAGGQVEFDSDSNVRAGLTVAGGEIELSGTVGRYLQVAGGRVRFDGTVAGDVEVAAGELRVGPQAVIEGTLIYRGREPPRIDPAAQVRGGVKHVQTRRHEHAARALLGAASLVWLAGWLLVGALLIAFLPAMVSRVTETLRTRMGSALLTGIVVLLATPIAIGILAVTLVGIPAALLLLLAYLALLALGYLASIATVADAALMRRHAATAPSRLLRIAAFIGAAIVLHLLAAIPWIGGLVPLALLIFGMGAVVQSVRGPRGTVTPPAG